MPALRSWAASFTELGCLLQLAPGFGTKYKCIKVFCHFWAMVDVDLSVLYFSMLPLQSRWTAGGPWAVIDVMRCHAGFVQSRDLSAFFRSLVLNCGSFTKIILLNAAFSVQNSPPGICSAVGLLGLYYANVNPAGTCLPFSGRSVLNSASFFKTARTTSFIQDGEDGL